MSSSPSQSSRLENGDQQCSTREKRKEQQLTTWEEDTKQHFQLTGNFFWIAGWVPAPLSDLLRHQQAVSLSTVPPAPDEMVGFGNRDGEYGPACS